MLNKHIQKVYDTMFNHRCDNPGYKKYFTYQDFEGIKEEKISFKTQDDLILRGGLYYNKASINDYSKLLIFFHGFAGGYLAYMTEISILVNHGFLVMAYDYQATFASDGDSLKGFGLPLVDFQSAYQFIKNHPVLKQMELSVIGHSWGGFTSIAAALMVDDITHVVALSAPLSLLSIVKQRSGILFNFIKQQFIDYEYRLFGDVVYFDGIDIVGKPVKLLSVYSTDDQIIYDKYNYQILREKDHNHLHQRIELHDRGHNPTYTKEAVKKLNDLVKRLDSYLKQGKTNSEIAELLKDVNWKEVVEQDLTIWKQIIQFLND